MFFTRQCKRCDAGLPPARFGIGGQDLCIECRCPPDHFRIMCDWFGNVCLRCGRGGPMDNDHVIAHDAGGRDGLRNRQPLCPSCNRKKQTKHADYRDPDLLAALLEYLGY